MFASKCVCRLQFGEALSGVALNDHHLRYVMGTLAIIIPYSPHPMILVGYQWLTE